MLDGVMKRLKSKVHGNSKHQVEPIKLEEEKLLATGQLGTCNNNQAL